jgi:uncharacterized membrane protein
MNAADPRLTRAFEVFRAHGGKVGLEALVNFLLPFLIYDHWRASLGDVKALMASSIPPILWSIVEFIRLRKVDAISMLVVAGILLSLVAFIGGGGVKVLQLRENLVTGLVGLVFLGSAAIGRPVVYELARANMRRRGPDGAKALEAVRDNVHVRRVITTSTVVWGLGLLTICGVCCVLVFTVSIKLYLLINGPISYALVGLLIGWNVWYVMRAQRRGRAREAAEAGRP